MSTAATTSDPQGGERAPLINGNGSNRASGSYGATAGPSRAPRRRPPSKKPPPSSAKIEAKVWFANERTWIAWLRASLLIGSFALAMLNSGSFFKRRDGEGDSSDFPGEPGVELPPSPYRPADGTVVSTFGTIYVLISVSTLLWGLFNYHRRVSLIQRKYPGPLDDLIGPPLICAAIFFAILLNFIFKVKEYRAQGASGI